MAFQFGGMVQDPEARRPLMTHSPAPWRAFNWPPFQRLQSRWLKKSGWQEGEHCKGKIEIIWKVSQTACMFAAALVFDGRRKNVLEMFPKFWSLQKATPPPKEALPTSRIPGRSGSRRGHPQPKRHQVTKPNPHLGISLTTAILYIILPPHHRHPYHGNRDMCELLCGGQSYQALGPLGPLLPLALIALDTMYVFKIYGSLWKLYIVQLGFTFPSLQ